MQRNHLTNNLSKTCTYLRGRRHSQLLLARRCCPRVHHGTVGILAKAQGAETGTDRRSRIDLDVSKGTVFPEAHALSLKEGAERHGEFVGHVVSLETALVGARDAAPKGGTHGGVVAVGHPDQSAIGGAVVVAAPTTTSSSSSAAATTAFGSIRKICQPRGSRRFLLTLFFTSSIGSSTTTAVDCTVVALLFATLITGRRRRLL